jgi:PIN domain nuclease of toxin-antitoxin system
MKLLLDTHVFVWWTQSPALLSAPVMAACGDRSNEVYISLATLWELQIKSQLGKLSLIEPLATQVAREMKANQFQLLAIAPEHIFALAGLPHHHRDPFDRMLAAQTLTENLTLVSKDSIFLSYNLPVLW